MVNTNSPSKGNAEEHNQLSAILAIQTLLFVLSISQCPSIKPHDYLSGVILTLRDRGTNFSCEALSHTHPFTCHIGNSQAFFLILQFPDNAFSGAALVRGSLYSKLSFPFDFTLFFIQALNSFLLFVPFNAPKRLAFSYRWQLSFSIFRTTLLRTLFTIFKQTVIPTLFLLFQLFNARSDEKVTLSICWINLKRICKYPRVGLDQASNLSSIKAFVLMDLCHVCRSIIQLPFYQKQFLRHQTRGLSQLSAISDK